MEPMIEIKGVSKKFILPTEKRMMLKHHIIQFYKRQEYKNFVALSDVSFSIPRGEFFGIVGKNGSGKSTLLKVISKILVPDQGEVIVRGAVSPFLELGVGFNSELTAKENVYLYGAVLGLTKRQIDSRFDSIIKFAGLEKFVHARLKTFSSGMTARLAFATAINVNAPILLLDEVLAVGDAAFQEKCFQTFERFKKEGKTIVFVSHSLSAVERFCDRAALMEAGKVVMIGDPKEVVKRYLG
jgi:ABC-type polysaccharide/polyol phosphate transport system ATPase subunit